MIEIDLSFNLLRWKEKTVDRPLITQLNRVSVRDSSYSFSPVVARPAVGI
jgi:hypothetical protein